VGRLIKVVFVNM